MRRILCLLLIVFLPLQVFAAQTGWGALGHGFDIQHEIEHEQGVSHHHDQDGSVHYNDADESAQHAVDHVCSHPVPGLLSATMQLPDMAQVRTITMSSRADMLDHIPERPQRPPRFLG
jgi:hypothetical protein